MPGTSARRLSQRPDATPKSESCKRIKLEGIETFLSETPASRIASADVDEGPECVINADATESSSHIDDGRVVQENPDSVEDGIELDAGDHCTICLQAFLDRTIIPTCTHEFCFECILMWAGASFVTFCYFFF